MMSIYSNCEIIGPEDIARTPKKIWSTEKTLEIVHDFVNFCQDKEQQKEIFSKLQTKGSTTIPCRGVDGEANVKLSRHARKTIGDIEKYMSSKGGAAPSLDALNAFHADLALAKRRILMQNIKNRANRLFHPAQNRQQLNTQKA